MVDPISLGDNPTVAQMKQQKEDSSKNFKAFSFLYSAIEDSIFPRIVGATTTKQAWDTLQEEYQDFERVRTVKIQTLRRECELLKMNEGETVKEHNSKLIEVMNKIVTKIVRPKIKSNRVAILIFMKKKN